MERKNQTAGQTANFESVENQINNLNVKFEYEEEGGFPLDLDPVVLKFENTDEMRFYFDNFAKIKYYLGKKELGVIEDKNGSGDWYEMAYFDFDNLKATINVMHLADDYRPLKNESYENWLKKVERDY